MKKIISSAFYMLIITSIYGQTTDFYYTFNNEKVVITKISGRNLVEFPDGLGNFNNPIPGIQLTEKSYIVAENNFLNSYSSNRYKTFSYLTANGLELNYTREILLKFKSGTSLVSKSNLTLSQNLNLIKSTPSYDLYLVVGDALQVSKIVYLSGLVEFCTPNFISKADKLEHLPNDEYFNNQWYLHNTGQGTNDGRSTTVDADIDAPEAWDITLGNPNITVAIIDEGVTSNHPDLPNTRQIRLNGSNFAFQYDGTNNPNDPSPIFVDFNSKGANHGNACAGIVGATQDNIEGITGIAPHCKIMPIKIPLPYTVPVSLYADAINFAVYNNADILSCSWGYYSSNPNLHPVIISAINYAIANNKLVVFSAGNNANRVIGNNGYVAFPANANIANLITVGASDRNNNQANYSPNGQALEIVAPSQTASNSQIPGEGPNVWTIDTPGLGVQGYNPINGYLGDMYPVSGEILPISGINFGAYTGRMGGTSAAAPEVAGVLALMKSVNSCLTAPQLKNILQLTTDKIGGFNYNWNSSMLGHSLELGYGKVNAFKAVQMAKLLNSPTLDLMVKDGSEDMGSQPNTATPYFWNSPDIWVRNNPDGIEEHQNPEYSPTVPNYAYVRITNKSCVTSTGTEQIKLYWAKASTSLSWPNSWNGLNNFPVPPAPTNTLLGAPIGIGTANIPILSAAGQETVIQMTFNNVPNPANYAFAGTDQWHYCMLARIESTTTDPSTENASLFFNVPQNNNIAMKNISIVDNSPNITNGSGTNGTIVSIGNPYNEPHVFDLQLIKEDTETGKPIYDEAEISIKMDDILLNAWQRGGKIAQKIDSTSDDRIKIVNDNNVLLKNVSFNANEIGILNLKFNFLTQELTNKQQFVYHVIQRDSQTNQIIGGETFVIKKQTRPIFAADAGDDKIVDKNEPITISATQISEPAIYNWYDTNGNLIFTGKNLTIATEVATKYKLEVIATADGFKDYSEININFKPSTLNNIIPNPAFENVNISYKLNDVGSAYLMIIGSYGTTGTTNNYILNIDSTTTNINLSNYQNGFYTVALVCNGQIVDAKTLIKQ